MAKNPTDPKGQEATTVVLQIIGQFFADGWLLMLALGVGHASSRIIPALGYWQSAFIAWVLAGLTVTGTHALTARVKKLGNLVVERRGFPTS